MSLYDRLTLFFSHEKKQESRFEQLKQRIDDEDFEEDIESIQDDLETLEDKFAALRDSYTAQPGKVINWIYMSNTCAKLWFIGANGLNAAASVVSQQRRSVILHQTRKSRVHAMNVPNGQRGVNAARHAVLDGKYDMTVYNKKN